jgi:hypothetical protein
MFWESCSFGCIEHNKIEFAIFGFFYYFILNLQVTGKSQVKGRIFLHSGPCKQLTLHNHALRSKTLTDIPLAAEGGSPAVTWDRGWQTNDPDARFHSPRVCWPRIGG